MGSPDGLRVGRHVTPDSRLSVGVVAFVAGRLDVAEAAIRRAVQLGDADTMNNFGVLFEHLDAVAEAERYYLHAANLGNTRAMNHLARLLIQRSGDDNRTLPEWWYGQAIQPGDRRRTRIYRVRAFLLSDNAPGHGWAR
jgi:TPR repeat protein